MRALTMRPQRSGYPASEGKYLGGGTNLVDLIRETVEQPDALVDVTGLSSAIEKRVTTAAC